MFTNNITSIFYKRKYNFLNFFQSFIRGKNSLLKSSLKGVGVVSACGFSYCYGAYHLTPFDFPEMAVRSLRLGKTKVFKFKT